MVLSTTIQRNAADGEFVTAIVELDTSDKAAGREAMKDVYDALKVYRE